MEFRMPTPHDNGDDLPILVIGAGITGLTASAALARRGFDVEMIERRDEISDGGGVGLSIVSNAMRALDTIGVADACVAAGMPMDTITLCRADGERLADSTPAAFGDDAWPRSTGITRAAFHAILLDAARVSCAIRCGTTMDDWTEDATGVDVHFSTGQTGRYRMVVAADGLYSSTRRKIFPDSQPAPTGQSVWRAEVPRPGDVRRTHLFFGGRHGAVGLCPVSEDRAYMYIVEGADPSVRRDGATLHTQMQAELVGYGGLIAELAPVLRDPDGVSYRPIEWLLAPAPWRSGRVVLVGDAAHANPPVLAQGAAMGIEDAIVLADELAATPDDVIAASDRFFERRYDRVRYIVEASCQLARWEVEHARDVDIPAVMRATAERMAEPI